MEYLYGVCNEVYHEDSDDDTSSSVDEINAQGLKRQKLSQVERLERNRIHARNTRERKKCQLETLQVRIKELVEEVSMKTLKNIYKDNSYVDIVCFSGTV
jgi:hypothetical protein